MKDKFPGLKETLDSLLEEADYLGDIELTGFISPYEQLYRLELACLDYGRMVPIHVTICPIADKLLNDHLPYAVQVLKDDPIVYEAFKAGTTKKAKPWKWGYNSTDLLYRRCRNAII